MRPETNRPDKASPKRSHDEIVEDRKAHLLSLVGRRLGEGLSFENLGPLAQAFLETIAGPQMKKALGQQRAVPAGLAKRLADDLEDLVGKDRFLLAPPADADDRPSELDGRKVQIVPNKGQDTHRLAGAMDLGAHVLGDVFRKFDIPADGMAASVADALRVGFERRADLANPRTWLSIVPQMAAAAMAAKGSWHARVGAAALAGINGLASMPQVIDVEALAPPERPDQLERGPDPKKNLTGDDRPRTVKSGSTERPAGTLPGGVLGMAQARVQSDGNRKLASEARAFLTEAGKVLEDPAAAEEIAKLLGSAASKGAGTTPRLIDLSQVPSPEGFVWPEVDPKVEDFANEALGPAGLNVQVEGANEAVAANFLSVLGMAARTVEQARQAPIDLNDPMDQAAVLRVAINNLVEVSPTAAALSKAFDAMSTSDPEQAALLQTQMERHERSVATTWVVEALTTRDPGAIEEAKERLTAALRRVQAQLDAHQGEEPPYELDNARVSLNAQLEALDSPDDLLAGAVLQGGLSELQYREGGEADAVGWSRMARSSYQKAALDAQMKFEVVQAAQSVAPEAAQALGRSSLATIWNVSAEAVGGPSVSPSAANGAGRSTGNPDTISSFQHADDYAASMGARVDKRGAPQDRRENFDDIRALLNDPSLEFFDKIFLVMTLLIDRMREKIEKDQIDQLDREEMMWINEQLAHEYQKEVEMAQRDIHELGKEVDKAAGAYTKAEHHLKRLEAMDEGDRSPDYDSKVAAAKEAFANAKEDWGENMGRFEKRKTVLNELRDARDAHRVQIASDRRSADIFAAKVKRNTHVVEMYMDLIKTFEEHKQRNLARLLNG